MARTIKRVDKLGSYITTFILCYTDENGSTYSTEINIPVWQADTVQTQIMNASWTTITNLFNLEGETIIKTE